MTIEEMKEWIDKVNNGTGNSNRPPELKKASKPCDNRDTFSLNSEQIGPQRNGELQVGTALDKGNPLNDTVVIQAYSTSNSKENIDGAKGKE